MTDTLTATLRTSQGTVVVRLFPDHAPKTVRNFTELAEGSRPWTDPATGQASTGKLYDGTIFHRVIPDFMIQGGDPLGSGRGGPGYKFGDEIHPDRADVVDRISRVKTGSQDRPVEDVTLESVTVERGSSAS